MDELVEVTKTGPLERLVWSRFRGLLVILGPATHPTAVLSRP